MAEAWPERPAAAAAASEPPLSAIFRQYYTTNDFFLSPEGILKILAAVVCVAWSAALVSSGWCAGAPGLVASAALAALAGGAACALLWLGALLAAPLRAPQAWLYTDLVASAAVGVGLLVSGALGAALCDVTRAADYVHAPLSLAASCLVLGSAGCTYAAVMRRWDASRAPREPRRPPPAELDV